MNLKCVIVDDEPLDVEILLNFIRPLSQVEVLRAFTDSTDALTFVNSNSVDLLLLDIEMPNLNGLELMRSLTHPPLVIFISAKKHYALEAFNLNVVDFLLKPVTQTRLLRAINKAAKLLGAQREHQPSQPRPNRCIVLRESNKMVKVDIDAILYIEADKNYTKVVTDSRIVSTRKRLKYFADRLNPVEFIRTHRSFIAAFKHIDAYTSTTIEVGGHEIPIGRIYRPNAAPLLDQFFAQRDANQIFDPHGATLDELEGAPQPDDLNEPHKNRFFKNAAHDLRNVISTFMTSTDLIVNKFDDLDRKKMLWMLNELNNLSHNAYFLVENMLDLFENQRSGRAIKPQALNLKVTVLESLEHLRNNFQRKLIDIDIDMSDDLRVWADNYLLCSVLRNVLSNAAKYTDFQGKVNISAMVGAQFCELSVADNGVGMDGDTLNNLFDTKAPKVKTGTNGEKGTGLGLILSHLLMKQLGGNITVSSKLGKGSTFTLKLPLFVDSL